VPGQNTYRLVNLPNPEHPGSEYLVSLGDYGVVYASVGFTGNALNFTGFGTPDNGGSVTIQAGTQQRTVLVATDGAVSITEPGVSGTIAF
jgi:hypothetical protein